jgi:hypothetical protein
MDKVKGLLFGIIYGLVARGIFAIEFDDNSILPTYGLMTISFLFLVPLIIGLFVAYHYDNLTSSRNVLKISMPVFSIFGLIGLSVFFGQEGIICALMALPIFAVMALIGGLIGVRIFERNKNKLTISLILFIPFLIAPLENSLGLTDKIFTEKTSITISSTDIRVWENITRVKEISKEENNLTLFQIMGFPRPIKAELDTIAIGGIRKAIFGRGLFFTETVTEVVNEKILAFDIKADPNSIPPTALDEHVLVGGEFFDVLEGKYEIEKLSDSEIRLHLTSKFRLSTGFNFYSGFWSKLIMSDIQKNILKIIKERSEKSVNTSAQQ